MDGFAKCMDSIINCFECFAKFLGHFLIAFVFFAISFLYTSGTFFIFPFMIKNSVILILTRLALFFFTVNLVYNYILCLITCPGFSKPISKREESRNEVSQYDIEAGELLFLESRNIFNDRNSQIEDSFLPEEYFKDHDKNNLFIDQGKNYMINCSKCNAIKHPRTHHCSICNKCILNMDHHCPWIGQCVGLYNRKYFILFLAWSFLSCFLISIFSIPMIIILLSSLSGINYYSDASLYDNVTFQGLLFSSVLSVSFSLGTGTLLFFHIYLLVTNQSTIEYHQNLFFRKSLNGGEALINRFDKGLSNNIREIMGTSRFPLLLFPCFY
ncbi:palmitoyltransferase-like protein [Cryptosporidium parvum]|uniref:Palmitoyltransferase n=2 Tax=Cryptosporidium parvum TaxID=5807 RepID=A0A7S7LFD4_CRYPV|nr:hypothetical protein CPATCC_0009010 [Cryptosporidium parvum]WKS79007.1 palmitoyltransferase-like protein [Cryptosporidium sp. 43IA8]WRK33493.1 hypothetical protein cpbgf_7003200 [Cryptosporidium parvum]|eukprot:QOY40638.1 hypothetical protein CPATCC_003520 [Cryptosporidium parvum]